MCLLMYDIAHNDNKKTCKIVYEKKSVYVIFANIIM